MSHPSVVSGPYTLTRYDAQSGTASFAINPYYKGNEDGEKPTIETIVYRSVANDEAIDLLLSGEVDLLNKMDSIHCGSAVLRGELPAQRPEHDQL